MSMGAAAYNRGSAAIRRQIVTPVHPVEFEIMARLNAMRKDERAPTPWGDVHFVEGHGGWWATCPTTGFGYWYSDLRQAVRAYCVEIHTYMHGVWIASPQPKS